VQKKSCKSAHTYWLRVDTTIFLLPVAPSSFLFSGATCSISIKIHVGGGGQKQGALLSGFAFSHFKETATALNHLHCTHSISLNTTTSVYDLQILSFTSLTGWRHWLEDTRNLNLPTFQTISMILNFLRKKASLPKHFNMCLIQLLSWSNLPFATQETEKAEGWHVRQIRKGTKTDNANTV